MSAKGLSSRAIIGEFYRTLEQDIGNTWIPNVSMYFGSDQESETYKWIGQVPQMREWIGGRQPKGFLENGITITNKHYESTLKVLKRELRRDKTGQLMVRIREQAQRANAHWASLLSTLIIDGESTVGYDGQFFFDTDHSEGSSGTQDNDITTTIANLPAQTHGSTTAPSPEEMQQAILKSIEQMYGFVDDQGEPINETASSFLVMVPVGLSTATRAALSMVREAGVTTFSVDNFNISATVNPRLTSSGSWTDKFVVLRTDGNVKPFIRQEEQGVQMAAKAEGSEYEFDNDAHEYGIDAWRNVGYGFWQHAVLNQLV
jgi:phage major head subunit gpT-like protein